MAEEELRMSVCLSGVERVMRKLLEIYAEFEEIEERKKKLMKACDENPPSPPSVPPQVIRILSNSTRGHRESGNDGGAFSLLLRG